MRCRRPSSAPMDGCFCPAPCVIASHAELRDEYGLRDVDETPPVVNRAAAGPWRFCVAWPKTVRNRRGPVMSFNTNSAAGRVMRGHSLPSSVGWHHRGLRCIGTILAFCAVLAVPPSRAAAPMQNGAAILVYHRFGPTAGSTTVSDAALDEQLAWLASHARVAPLRSVVDALRAAPPPPGAPVSPSPPMTATARSIPTFIHASGATGCR